MSGSNLTEGGGKHPPPQCCTGRKKPSAFSVKDTTEATFIKHFNDKADALDNQIITGLLVLVTRGCKHCPLHSVIKSTYQSSFISNFMQL